MTQLAHAGLSKIAVLRASALGDFVFALPAFEALRSAYPAAEVVLFGREWHRSFLDGRCGPIDRVIPVPPVRGVTLAPEAEETADAAKAQERFCEAMRQERFDLAIQLHGGGRYSNALLQRFGATRTIALKTVDAPALDAWIPYIYYQHEVLRCLEVVALAGAPAVGIEPRLQVTQSDQVEAAAVLGPMSAAPLAILHPGASDPRRRWPAAKFAAVGDALARAGARVAVTGTGPEQGLVAELLGAMHAPAQNLSSRLSIGGLAGVLARASVVISNDSGPLHLAAAVGAPTVGIYWCGNLINAGPHSRARHRPLLSWQLHCSECGADCTRDRCDHLVSYVADVSVDEVASAALELMACSDVERCD